MKKLFIFLPLALSLCGCSDFLDRHSYDKQDSDGYYVNDNALNSAVLACYNGIHGTLDREFFVTEVRSDNTRNKNQGPTGSTDLEITHLDIFTVESSNALNTAYWQKVYHNIANCNTVLDNIDGASDPALRLQYEAEARFIRAYHYFNLVRLYGPVFIVTERISAETARMAERSPESEVYDLILSDLRFAATELPEAYDEANLGRATQWAAKTLLAKVYLTLYGDHKDTARLTDAKTLLEDVRDNGGYDLVRDPGTEESAYANVFSTSNEMNRELIFVSRYLAGGKGIGSPFANYFAPQSSEDAVIYGSGSGYNCPTEDLIDAYNSEAHDERKNVVLSETWTSKVGVVQYVAWAKKYFSQVTVRYDAENDWPILRYADVLLMLGEIENELNGPTSQAVAYLNETRQRAGLEPAAPANRVEYRAALSKERRLEFALENQRFFDLVRTGQIYEVMENHFRTEQIRNQSSAAKTSYYGNSRYNTYVADPTIHKWQLLLPIPYDILITAPYATQNVGY